MNTSTNITGATSKRRPLRIAWRIARPFVVAYVCFLVIAMFMETRLVYPAPSLERGDWHSAGLDHEDVWFKSADGTRLHGWFLPNISSKRAILYCHGNGEHVALDAKLVAMLRRELNANVFVFDYRGYGRSDGSPNEAGCIADGQAARTWLAERLGIKPTDIVLLGHSLGGGVAVALAADGGAKALVVENSFSSMPAVAAHTYWWLPVRLVMKNRYDSASRIQKYDGPLFQSHGTNDTLVPIQFGRKLFDAAPGKKKTFMEGAGLGHDDGPPDDYYRELAIFLDEVDQTR